MRSAPPALPAHVFEKADPGDDRLFYVPPRLVTHLDGSATAALTAHYEARIAPGSVVLDLMSSWVSHLPPSLALANVVGHGMNATELAANPQLDSWFVQDLNREPGLPLDDCSFDAVLCCVSVQYLQRPFNVFADVRRVLRPAGRVIVSYSNRCFPTKAIAAWLSLDMAGRARLIGRYLEQCGFGAVEVIVLSGGLDGDPLIAVEAWTG